MFWYLPFSNVFHPRRRGKCGRPSASWSRPKGSSFGEMGTFPSPIGSMYGIYMVTFTSNIPPMLAYIPAPWILWVKDDFAQKTLLKLNADNSRCAQLTHEENQAMRRFRCWGSRLHGVGRKTEGVWRDRDPSIEMPYPLVNVYITMENHNF
jgi:hypothetical protein